MNHTIRIAIALATAVIASSAAANAEPSRDDAGTEHSVFVQTNDPAGNAVVVFDRSRDGTLTLAGIFPTGGKGGRAAVPELEPDPLASQGSLVYDRSHQLLFAVNTGSDTISVFQVDGDQLELTQVVSSGGPFPISIAVQGNLAYVLDAGLAGFVTGFRIDDRHLEPLQGSTRSLGLANMNPPFFLSSPAQVGFTPNGTYLLVTTKIASTVEAFAVAKDGRLSADAVRTPVTPAPFAFLFGPSDRLVLTDVLNSSVSTFSIGDGGSLVRQGGPVPDGQLAACWIVSAHEFQYVANAHSDDISQYRVRDDGSVVLVNATAATGIPGTTDMTTAGSGQFLYVLSGFSASVYAYRVEDDGSLSFIQTVAVPGGASMEGIAAN